MDNKNLNIEMPIENENTKSEETNQMTVEQTENVQSEPVQTTNDAESNVEIPVQAEMQVPQPAELPTEKKIKTDTFNSEEKVLYEIKQEAEGNPLVVVAFIVILILFVIFLPQITEKTQNFNKKEAPIASNPATQEPVEEESLYHGFHEESTIGKLRISNIVTSHINGEYKVSFTLVNESNEPYTFDKKYYLALYDEELLVYRALIHSYEPIASKAALEVNLVISQKAYNDANKYELQEIVTGRYPTAILQSKEGNYDTLKCTYLNTNITYYFEDKMLIKIKEEYTEQFENNPNYETSKASYIELSNRYKLVNGFTSTIIENPSDFRLLNELDLVTIQNKDLSDLKVYRYFKFREDVNIVAFEMASKGYTCG